MSALASEFEISRLEIEPVPFAETKLSRVHRAVIKDTPFGYVAYKEPKLHVPGMSAFRNERRELWAAQDITGVIPVIGEGVTSDDIPFRILHYASKGNLYKQENPKNSQQTLLSWGIVRGIAVAVSELHARQVVHRDLTLSNMLVDSDDTPYLPDFGLASHFDKFPDGYQEGDVPGTLEVLSVERMKGVMGLTESDTFSFSVSVFQLLSGRHPWLGPKENVEVVGVSELERRMVNHKPVLSQKVRARIPPEVLEFLMGGLDPDPLCRPPMSQAVSLT